MYTNSKSRWAWVLIALTITLAVQSLRPSLSSARSVNQPKPDHPLANHQHRDNSQQGDLTTSSGIAAGEVSATEASTGEVSGSVYLPLVASSQSAVPTAPTRTATATSNPTTQVATSTTTPIFSPTATKTPGPSLTPTPLPNTTLRWSQSLPTSGAVTISANQIVLLDTDVSLQGLQIEGTLICASQDLTLSAAWIMLHGGKFLCGSEQQPFAHTLLIILNASNTNENVMNMGTRGIFVMGGALELFGVVPSPVWTKLNAHAITGTTTLTLKDATNWQIGDQVVLAPTDFLRFDGSNRPLAGTQKGEVISASDKMVTLAAPVQKFRWGLLQYVTSSGMSLTPDPSFTPPMADTPTVLDERAEVGNLSRNIIIQAPDDTLWREQGFGAHVMMMDRTSSIKLDGIELRRMGQAGRTGRYPLHWHLMSYASNGNELGDASGQFIRNSAIWNSQQRCIVIHGTNGVTVQNNICYDIRGHAIFLEDAVERRNRIEGNLALQMRIPTTPLMNHERDVFQAGPSGFWITNPDNIVVGNAAADAVGNGFWLSFPTQAQGVNANVSLFPHRMALGMFDDNTAHSNRAPGINIDWIVMNAQGDVTPNSYAPMVDGINQGYDFSKWLRADFRRNVTYKNGDSGLWNRVTWPTYDQWVSADNVGRFFAGAGSDGRITRTLMVGTSLNLTPLPYTDYPPAAAATYHSTFDIANNLIVNFAYVDGMISGAFATDDYYIRAVDKGLIRNPNNLLINSHPGHRLKPILAENWTLAGALWDPHGYWGTPGNFWTYDEPFFTEGGDCQSVAPAGQNGASCAGPFYGVGGFLLNRSTDRYLPHMPIRATRQTANGDVLDEWTVGDGDLAPKLGNMRHFAARKGGRYTIQFPGWSGGIPTDTALTIENAYRSDDWFLLGVSFSGSIPADAYLTTWYNYEDAQNFQPGSHAAQFRQEMSPTTSLANVIAAPGTLFWQESANNLVWVKIVGGLPAPGEADFQPNTDDFLYRARYLRVHAQ